MFKGCFVAQGQPPKRCPEGGGLVHPLPVKIGLSAKKHVPTNFVTTEDPKNHNVQIYVFYELRSLILILCSAVEMDGSLNKSDRINFSKLKIFKMFVSPFFE